MLRDVQREVDHWRLVTKLSRVIGIAFILAGIMGATQATRAVLDPRISFAVDGVPNDSLAPRIAAAAASSLVVILGMALVSVRAYRPDLGDRNLLDKFVDPFDTFVERKTNPYRGNRSWWTGDPKG